MTPPSANQKPTKPAPKRRQSRLAAYRQELVTLRSKGYSFQKMADYLAAVHQPVSRRTVHAFMEKEGLL